MESLVELCARVAVRKRLLTDTIYLPVALFYVMLDSCLSLGELKHVCQWARGCEYGEGASEAGKENLKGAVKAAFVEISILARATDSGMAYASYEDAGENWVQRVFLDFRIQECLEEKRGFLRELMIVPFLQGGAFLMIRGGTILAKVDGTFAHPVSIAGDLGLRTENNIYHKRPDIRFERDLESIVFQSFFPGAIPGTENTQVRFGKDKIERGMCFFGPPDSWDSVRCFEPPDSWDFARDFGSSSLFFLRNYYSCWISAENLKKRGNRLRKWSFRNSLVFFSSPKPYICLEDSVKRKRHSEDFPKYWTHVIKTFEYDEVRPFPEDPATPVRLLSREDPATP